MKMKDKEDSERKDKELFWNTISSKRAPRSNHLPRVSYVGSAFPRSVFCLHGELSAIRYETLRVDVGCHLFASLSVGRHIHLSDWTGDTASPVPARCQGWGPGFLLGSVLVPLQEIGSCPV